jgi:hypothetical protein
MWSPFLLLIALPLSLRSVRAQSALFLTGPATVTACIPAVFTWTNGTSPYTFHPSVGTDGVPQQEVGGILDAAFAWYAENQPAGKGIPCAYCLALTPFTSRRCYGTDLRRRRRRSC